MAEGHAAFGRYRVTGTLGAGGMGEVYAAIDEVLGREVAVKTLRGNHSGLAARMLDERFKQEARAIAALTHPGVVQVFDIDLTAEPPYIVMERVAGPTLKQQLATAPLAIGELRALGIQIARALAAAHAAGIVHRDVKPANILAAGGGMWKLADFGVAHVPDSALTMTGQFVGSPAYAPPEALVRGQSGPPGDIYGLGACLYEAALGRWPRADATSGALLAPTTPLHELAPHVPAELAAAIDRAILLEPESRPTAGELADALAGASSHTPLPIPAAPLPARPANHDGSRHSMTRTSALHAAARWRLWIYAGAAAFVLLLVVGLSRCGSKAQSPAAAAPGLGSPTPTPPADPDPPQEIRARPPPNMDGKANKDWNKIVDKLYDHHWGEARRKLVEFERKRGESVETKELREQLDALIANQPEDDDHPR